MRYRLLGRTGLYVSELALGTNMHGGKDERWKVYGALGQQESTAVMGAAIDGGINFIDTADSYGEGESEMRVGQAVRDLKLARDRVLIGSKVYIRTGPGPNDVGASRGHIMSAVEGSLKRLQTDYLDLYTLHNYDTLTPLEETLRAFDDLVRQGKVRYIGCSNFAAWQVMKANGISDRMGYVRFQALENLYMLGSREVEREIVPMLLDQGMSLLVWGPLASGILSGKYKRDGTGPAGSRLTYDEDSKLRPDLVAGKVDKAFDALDALAPIAAAHGVPVAQVALAWLLSRPGLTAPIIGATKLAQLEDALASTSVALGQEDLDELDRSYTWNRNLGMIL